jgi:hypothetical protein
LDNTTDQIAYVEIRDGNDLVTGYRDGDAIIVSIKLQDYPEETYPVYTTDSVKNTLELELAICQYDREYQKNFK